MDLELVVGTSSSSVPFTLLFSGRKLLLRTVVDIVHPGPGQDRGE